jgi:hypothetical protein
MKRLATLLGAAAARLPALLNDAVGAGGLALVAYGAYEIYRPAGFIIGGAGLIIISIGLARR